VGQRQDVGDFEGILKIFEKKPLLFGGSVALNIWIIAHFLEKRG